uniref:Uncharacterized protein n=1 Tax=Oryza nivara TaxID=4536 RepID=A0A0E0HJ23_ORYNI
MLGEYQFQDKLAFLFIVRSVPFAAVLHSVLPQLPSVVLERVRFGAGLLQVVKFALARGASLLHRQAVKCVLVEVQVRLGGSLLFSGHLGVSVLLFNFIARFGAGLLEVVKSPIVGTWKLLEEERVPVLR